MARRTSFHPTAHGGIVRGLDGSTTYEAANFVGALVASDSGKTINIAPGQALKVEFFTVTPVAAELGSTITTVTLDWDYDKPVNAQSIDPDVPPLTSAQRQVILTGLALDSTTNWTLTANAGQGNVAAVATLTFLARRMWGVSNVATPTAADLDFFGFAELANTRLQVREFDGQGKYLYFAWPTTLGDPQFKSNGFLDTAWIKTVVTYTNPFGVVLSYNVYRSLYKQLGSGIEVEVT